MPNPSVRHFGFKKVVNLSQDVRFKDKQKKLYKNLVVHKNIKSIPKRAVDIKKVNMEVIKELSGILFLIQNFCYIILDNFLDSLTGLDRTKTPKI